MRKSAKLFGELQVQLAEERAENQALCLGNDRLSATKRRRKVIADPNTQFSNMEATKMIQE